MGDLKESRDLVRRLFDLGSTSNEDLQTLLILLKEISESSPDDLKSEFLEIFPDISKGVLDSTNDMLSIFLTHLAMLAKPTKDSENFIQSNLFVENLLTKLQEVQVSLKEHLQAKY